MLSAVLTTRGISTNVKQAPPSFSGWLSVQISTGNKSIRHENPVFKLSLVYWFFQILFSTSKLVPAVDSDHTYSSVASDLATHTFYKKQ